VRIFFVTVTIHARFMDRWITTRTRRTMPDQSWMSLKDSHKNRELENTGHRTDRKRKKEPEIDYPSDNLPVQMYHHAI
jgi:hypothetical protein